MSVGNRKFCLHYVYQRLRPTLPASWSDNWLVLFFLNNYFLLRVLLVLVSLPIIIPVRLIVIPIWFVILIPLLITSSIIVIPYFTSSPPPALIIIALLISVIFVVLFLLKILIGRLVIGLIWFCISFSISVSSWPISSLRLIVVLLLSTFKPTSITLILFVYWQLLLFLVEC